MNGGRKRQRAASGNGKGLGMKAVILAGGKGTRLRPYTYAVPKPLLPYKGKPILENIIDYLKSYGIRDIILSIGYLGYQIKNYFGDGSRFGVAIEYIEEKESMGTAGCLTLLKDRLKGTFLLFGGDNITDLNLDGFIKFHKKSGALLTVALFEHIEKAQWGIYEIDGKGAVQKFLEKPEFRHDAGTMIFCVEPAIMAYLPEKVKGVINLTDHIVPKLLERKEKVFGYRFSGQWIDIGNVEEYNRLNAE
ncbi:MAG: nucleotidyltransferase family protein [Candidatus Aenigmarchaeota archaeon]|nr:nucleotidyltransferase family protein [Candidatus Aenigmarchaeota archaeon]